MWKIQKIYFRFRYQKNVLSTQLYSKVPIFISHSLCYCFCTSHAFHQRQTHRLISVQCNYTGLCFWRRLHQGHYSLCTHTATLWRKILIKFQSIGNTKHLCHKQIVSNFFLIYIFSIIELFKRRQKSTNVFLLPEHDQRQRDFRLAVHDRVQWFLYPAAICPQPLCERFRLWLELRFYQQLLPPQ